MGKIKEANPHHGQGVKNFRELENMTIEELSVQIGVTAEELCALETQAQWAEETLQKAADALHVPYIILENYNPSPKSMVYNVITDNTFTNTNSAGGQEFITGEGNDVDITNNKTIDKVVELYYDQVKEMKEIIIALQKELAELKNKK